VYLLARRDRVSMALPYLGDFAPNGRWWIAIGTTPRYGPESTTPRERRPVEVLTGDIASVGSALQVSQIPALDTAAYPFSYATAVDGEGTVAAGTGDTGDYVVWWISQTGQIEGSASLPVDPKVRSPEAIRRMEARSPVPGFEASEEDPLFDLFAFNFDARNRLWVKTRRGEGQTTVFDVFGSDRSYLGEVSVEARGLHWDVGEDILVMGTVAEGCRAPANGKAPHTRTASTPSPKSIRPTPRGHPLRVGEIRQL